MPALFPSLIASNLLALHAEIKRLEPYCDGFHIDVMDGHFVANLTWGPIFVNAIRGATDKPLWVHLMVDRPQQYIPLMHLHPGDMVSIHYECTSLDTLRELLKELELRSLQTSVAINPGTAVAAIVPLIEQTPLASNFLLMSVEPGASGQKFLPQSLLRLKELVALQQEFSATFTISMDGGITPENVGELKPFPVDAIAVASGIFGQKDQIAAMKQLRA